MHYLVGEYPLLPTFSQGSRMKINQATWFLIGACIGISLDRAGVP
jgi:hypothetical protein